MIKRLIELNITYFSEDPFIEENDDGECVIRIAPKPIKIKIKPILPPPTPLEPQVFDILN